MLLKITLFSIMKRNSIRSSMVLPSKEFWTVQRSKEEIQRSYSIRFAWYDRNHGDKVFLHKSRVILPTKGDPPTNRIPSSSEIEIEQKYLSRDSKSFWRSETVPEFLVIFHSSVPQRKLIQNWRYKHVRWPNLVWKYQV